VHVKQSDILNYEECILIPNTLSKLELDAIEPNTDELKLPSSLCHMVITLGENKEITLA
jgi:hypothetical protein